MVREIRASSSGNEFLVLVVGISGEIEICDYRIQDSSVFARCERLRRLGGYLNYADPCEIFYILYFFNIFNSRNGRTIN